MQLRHTLVAMMFSTSLFSAFTMAAEKPSSASQTNMSSSFTPEQETRIGEVAADYLMAHPDVLVKVSQALEVQQHEQQTKAMTGAVMANYAALTEDKSTPSIGPADAKVVVVEFFDYQCVYCSHLAPVMDTVMKVNPQVRFVFKEWPIFGERWENSRTAAKTGLQIWQQKGADAYLAYHNGLFATGHNEGKLTADDIRKAAARVKFNSTKAADVQGALDDINILAQHLGFGGTPALVVVPTSDAASDNTTVIPGMATAEALQVAIDRAGNKQK